jgi:hypothetical protein
VFDEPRQQSAGDRSLQMLVARASTAGSAGAALLLFATSEPHVGLEPMLDGLSVQYMPIDGRLLTPRS